jgi:hypothetical protein
MNKPPPEPTDKGSGYAAADEAIAEVLNPIEWYEGVTERIAEYLNTRGIE